MEIKLCTFQVSNVMIWRTYGLLVITHVSVKHTFVGKKKKWVNESERHREGLTPSCRRRPWFSPVGMSFSWHSSWVLKFLRCSRLHTVISLAPFLFARKSGKVDSSRQLVCTFCPLIAINEINCLSASPLGFDEAHVSAFSRPISI